MLIEFSVGNYLSIKDRQTLRLDASSISEYKDQLIDAGRYQLLRSAVIYGANASGKSNVLRAMAAMRHIVERSAEHSSTAPIPVYSFRLSTETEVAPSYFEVLILLDNTRYRYGFETDRKAIHAEWLYIAKKEQEKPLFWREGSGIQVFKEFKEGKGLEEKTRNNALFLAVCDQFNGQISKQILTWFNHVATITGLKNEDFRPETNVLLSDKEHNSDLLAFLGGLNLGFEHIHLHDELLADGTVIDLPGTQRRLIVESTKGPVDFAILTTHPKYDSSHKVVGEESFLLDQDESAGTKKIFDLVGPIFQMLHNGGILVIDELDAKLHSLITQCIIRLFNDPTLNPNNAQLIFATHDTNLLAYGSFRRDQIYFTEKDQYGATCLYSLVEYQEENGSKVRKDSSFEKDYIQGRYGAIPFIGDLSKLVPAWHEK